MINVQLGVQDLENLIKIIDQVSFKGSEAEYVFKLRSHLVTALQSKPVEAEVVDEKTK